MSISLGKEKSKVIESNEKFPLSTAVHSLVQC